MEDLSIGSSLTGSTHYVKGRLPNYFVRFGVCYLDSRNFPFYPFQYEKSMTMSNMT